jgi:SAM-dependent methyltransferase
MSEQYTLGFAKSALAFVGRRRLATHGAFFVPFLRAGMRVLDCGCGPGSMTCDIADVVAPAQVVGLDAAASQVDLARARAADLGTHNVRFEVGSAYELPHADESFDFVYCHAVMEHLADPRAALREFLRVLAPAGKAGLCAPDWRGFLYSPETPEFLAAIERFTAIQKSGGGDVDCGRKLRDLALEAGFSQVQCTARYEVFEPVSIIIDLLSDRLRLIGEHAHADVLQAWARQPGVMFAEAWVSCVATK